MKNAIRVIKDYNLGFIIQTSPTDHELLDYTIACIFNIITFIYSANLAYIGDKSIISISIQYRHEIPMHRRTSNISRALRKEIPCNEMPVERKSIHHDAL